MGGVLEYHPLPEHAAFAQCDKVTFAAKENRISYWTVIHWQKNEVFDFVCWMKPAHQPFCENKIEHMIDDCLENPQGNRGSDVLLMFRAKPEMPHQYRARSQGIGNGRPHEYAGEATADGYKRAGGIRGQGASGCGGGVREVADS